MTRQLLDSMPTYTLFVGKGGAGKTTVASAVAATLARNGSKTLLVSVDPTADLVHVLQHEVGCYPDPIAVSDHLAALDLDERMIGEITDDPALWAPHTRQEWQLLSEVIPDDQQFEVARLHRFACLLTDGQLREEYEHIVIDTAAIDYALRQLQQLCDWSTYFEERAAGQPSAEAQQLMDQVSQTFADACQVLADSALTKVVLVARADAATLHDGARAYEELEALDMRPTNLVVNGLLWTGTKDPLARGIMDDQKHALSNLPQPLLNLPRVSLALRVDAPTGLERLTNLLAAHDIPADDRIAQLPRSGRELKELATQLATQEHGLLLVVGKDGVGKTTVSAALALALAELGRRVHLVTADPVLEWSLWLPQAPTTLLCSSLHADQPTQRYVLDVFAELDGEPSADAPSEESLAGYPHAPESDALAAFDAIVERAERELIIVDTAATASTLSLLELLDPAVTRAIMITSPDAAGVNHGASMTQALAAKGVNVAAWVANGCLSATSTYGPILQRRSTRETEHLDALVAQYGQNVYLVAQQPNSPLGAEALRASLTLR